MFDSTYKYFNLMTRNALIKKVNGYVDKSKSVSEEIINIKANYKLDKVYRFDLGENVDGFSNKVKEFFDNSSLYIDICKSLNEYPDITHCSLRQEIANFYGIQKNNVVISAGLDSILDIISRIFINNNDYCLMPSPDFFLFENYSERMGARPLYVILNERNNFEWTDETFKKFCDLIIQHKPKIAWLSNPNNPTGQLINKNYLKDIIEFTFKKDVFLVIDEAYGEYIQDQEYSAIKYIKNYKHLMVLRNFSKAYGLAGLRIGYLMTSSKDIINAFLIYRHYFPAIQLALNIASIALKDQDFIKQTIINCYNRYKVLYNQFENLKTFKIIPSCINIYLLRNKYLSNIELYTLLKKRGIISSIIRNIDEPGPNYLRITLKKEEENNFLVKKCEEIEKEILELGIGIERHQLSN